jgi:hypothetical protein
MRRLTGLTLFAFGSSVYASAPIRHFTPADYIEQYKTAAVLEMQRFNIPASITLAQAIVESKYGNSDLAVNANNHFGIKCHKEWAGPTYTMDDDEKNECFRKYEFPLDSYEDHSMFLASRPRYACLFELPKTDYIAWARGLKEAGYATHPRYTDMLIEVIERYKLYELDDACLNPVLYAERIDPRRTTERRFTSDYLFYVLKYNEVGFAIPRPGNSFFNIVKEFGKSAEKHLYAACFREGGETPSHSDTFSGITMHISAKPALLTPAKVSEVYASIQANGPAAASFFNPAHYSLQDVADNRKRKSEEIITHVERRK